MNRSLVKYAAFMICVIIAASFTLKSCTGITFNPKKDEVRQEGQTTAKAAAKKKLVLWHIQLSDSVSTVIKDAVDRYMKVHPDVEVEVVPYLNDAYKIKLVVAMGTRNPPDIFPSWGGGPLREYIKAGQVYDITPMMQKDNYEDYFLSDAFSMVTYDGKIWGVPVENIVLAAIFYNKVLFKENNISPPRTYEELLQVVRTLRARGISPFALANRTKWTGSMFYMYLVDRIGGPEVFRRAADRTGGSFEDEAFIKAGRLIQELVSLGAFPQGFNGLDYDTGQSRQLMYSGKAAMELMGTWNISTIKDENRYFYNNNLDFFPFPSVEGGKGDPNDAIGTFADNFYCISSNTKYPEEAFGLIKFLIDDDAVKARVERGRIPPIRNFKTDDEMLQKVLGLVSKAPSVQLWYDQYLPPELGEKHKDTCQALFDGSITPEGAARELEKAAQNFYKTQK